jgi:hypothetical protein
MIEKEFIRHIIERYRDMLQTQSDADIRGAIQKTLDGFEARTAHSPYSATQHEQDVIHVGSLLFRCPITHAEFASGIEIDVHSLSQLQELAVHAFCPTCERHHDFRVKDGTVETFRFVRPRPHKMSKLSI